jgi:O-methyltransferase
MNGSTSAGLSKGPIGRVQTWREKRGIEQLVARARTLSMVYEPQLHDLALKVQDVVDSGVPGDLVECGVWRGGSALLMAEVLERSAAADRKVWLFDSFEGLPEPEEVDGPGALRYSEDKDDPMYLDNCRADVEAVTASAREWGLEGRTRIVKGWFDDTLPAAREEIGQIALLRIDADWHSSVTTCLEALFDQVAPGGYVIFDDYYVWDGCAVAVHEFMGRRSLAYRIHETAAVAWLQKAA